MLRPSQYSPPADSAKCWKNPTDKALEYCERTRSAGALMGNGIDGYARRFARLRTNRNRKVWSEVTAHQAPHKPILLLCVLDLFDSGEIPSNLIEISDDLAELFGRYWERVLP